MLGRTVRTLGRVDTVDKVDTAGTVDEVDTAGTVDEADTAGTVDNGGTAGDPSRARPKPMSTLTRTANGSATRRYIA
jgi:hypothetical protein